MSSIPTQDHFVFIVSVRMFELCVLMYFNTPVRSKIVTIVPVHSAVDWTLPIYSTMNGNYCNTVGHRQRPMSNSITIRD